MDKEVTDHIVHIRDSQARTETTIENINKTLETVVPAFDRRLANLEATKQRMWGAGAVITGLGALFETLFHMLYRHGGR